MMQTNFPFRKNYDDSEDRQLISAALEGDKKALAALTERHQPYIYNVAWKMVLNPDDAWDITQEVLIKVITKLSNFRGESKFRTWLYRITVNHFLQMKKRSMEQAVTDFDSLGAELDSIPDLEPTETEKSELREFTKDAKIGCMSGMLLCLSREQRLVYVLGEIFEVDHITASEILRISPDNFRKRLSRARHDLYNFMNRKCGLVNKENPCRCTRKTKGFIKAGWVDKKDMKFNIDHRRTIAALSPEKDQALSRTVDESYADLFREHPFREQFDKKSLMKSILDDSRIREIFDF